MRSCSHSPTCDVKRAMSSVADIASSQRPSKTGRIAGSAIPNAIDEKAGRPFDSAEGAAFNVPLDARLTAVSHSSAIELYDHGCRMPMRASTPSLVARSATWASRPSGRSRAASAGRKVESANRGRE